MTGAVSRHIRTHVVGYVALFVALGGSAYATSQIGSQDIATNAVLSRHLQNGQVKRADLGTNSVDSSKLANGSVGTGELGAGAVTPADTGAVPVASLLLAGSQVTAPSGTVVNIPWDDDTGEGVLDIDNDGMHSYTTNPNQFTIHTPGIYMINARVVWDAAANATGIRRIDVLAGGLSSRVSQVAGSTSVIEQEGTIVIRLLAGNTVRLQAQQTSGADLGVTGRQINIHWIGP